MERWRLIPGFGGRYEISDQGRVRSNGQRILIATPTYSKETGRIRHVAVTLCDVDGRRVNGRIHRLVLQAFVGECPPGLECRHLDGDPTNNRVDNLRWGTHAENEEDRQRHGNIPCGSRNGQAKLTEEEAHEIMRLKGTTTQQKIAERFGISRSQVSHIHTGFKWSSLLKDPV